MKDISLEPGKNISWFKRSGFARWLLLQIFGNRKAIWKRHEKTRWSQKKKTKKTKIGTLRLNDKTKQSYQTRSGGFNSTCLKILLGGHVNTQPLGRVQTASSENQFLLVHWQALVLEMPKAFECRLVIPGWILNTTKCQEAKHIFSKDIVRVTVRPCEMEAWRSMT